MTRRASHRISHRTLPVGDIDVHVAQAGQGPPVVMLHGCPELWYSWRHQMAALAGSGYRTIAPDLRGYGATSRPAEIKAYGRARMVADVTGLLDSLGVGSATLVRHDWSAQIAWACAQLHSERVDALAILGVPTTHVHRHRQHGTCGNWPATASTGCCASNG